jgi:hypothetical protein
MFDLYDIRERKLIAFCGKAQCGKDTSVALIQNLILGQKISFAAPMREFMRDFLGYESVEAMHELYEVPHAELGWKTPRYALQTLGTEWGRNMIYDNMWVDKCIREADKIIEDNAGFTPLISDVRFQNEAVAIKNSGGIIIKVVRGDAPEITNMTHSSENGIDDEYIDYTIHNNGTLTELSDKLREILINEGVL